MRAAGISLHGLCVYLSIICAAWRARSTSQKGKRVPMANMPTKAMPKAIQDMTPTCAGWPVSTVLVVALVVLTALVVGFTAMAVAPLLLLGAARVPLLADLVELR